MPVSIKEIVGWNIARLRKQAGMTQRELGKALGTSDKAVHLWEKGQTWPEAEKIDQMSEVLRVPVWEFFGASAPSLEASLELILEELGYDASALKKKTKS